MPLTWFLTIFKTDKLPNEEDQQGQGHQQQRQQQRQQQQQDENIYEDAATVSQQSDAHSRFSNFNTLGSVHNDLLMRWHKLAEWILYLFCGIHNLIK